jgi:HK97 family phage portal protein
VSVRSWLLGHSEPETRAAKPLTSADLLTVLGGGGQIAGVTVTEESAPKLTAVWRAVALLSGAVASLPLKAYRDAEGGRIETPSTVLRRPHPTMTRYEWVELAMVHLLIAGNFYAAKQVNGFGEVTGLLPVAPNQVVPKLDANGVKTFEVPGVDKPRITVGTDAILHIPGMGYDGIKGWSPIAMCRRALAVGMAAEEFSAKFFSQGSHLGGIITADGDLKPEQAEEARRTIGERISGLAKAHEVAVLAANFKYQSLGIAPEDAQLIESRQFSIQDVGRVYGLPNHLLNEASGSTSWASGLSEQVRGLLVFTLAPWLTRIEDRLALELLPHDQYAEFTRAGLLQSTTKERFETYELGIRAGFMAPSECRALENWGPLTPEQQVELDKASPKGTSA